MQLIDGKKIAREIRKKLKKNLTPLVGREPGLAFIVIGEDPASLTYVGMKRRACLEVGILSTIVTLPASTSEKRLLDEIERLNRSSHIDGILVQQPFPPQIETRVIIGAIAPEKDVDGFHPLNMGKLLLGDRSGFVPCTPLGIVQLLEKSCIEVSGKEVVIVGRSNIVGKPLAALLMQKGERANATVTLVHSHTRDLQAHCKRADILVAALGRPHFIDESMVKEGAVVIDVGINRTAEGLVGDVHFERVKERASALTPVPGGVGPMTIAMLLANTIRSFRCRSFSLS